MRMVLDSAPPLLLYETKSNLPLSLERLERIEERKVGERSLFTPQELIKEEEEERPPRRRRHAPFKRFPRFSLVFFFSKT